MPRQPVGAPVRYFSAIFRLIGAVTVATYGGYTPSIYGCIKQVLAAVLGWVGSDRALVCVCRSSLIGALSLDPQGHHEVGGGCRLIRQSRQLLQDSKEGQR